MNIEQAKGIALSKFLEKLGHLAVKTNSNDAWYLSPLRNEKTPSFKVNVEKNVWYDFGLPGGGDIIEFACQYLKSRGEDFLIPDALRFLKNISNGESILYQPKENVASKKDKESVFKLTKVGPITHAALIRYVDYRGISLELAKMYLKQLCVHNTKTNSHMFALGFKNDEDGYELRNPLFKGTLGKKYITSIRGTDSNKEGVHIFEGYFDFLSALTISKKTNFPQDTKILNSLACLKMVQPYFQDSGYKVAHTWLDNDSSGNNATEAFASFCKEIGRVEHIKMNNVYLPFKDVNEWHMDAKANGHIPRL